MVDSLLKCECTGCGACENICPTKCITMEMDTLGFKYPIIDKTKCTECGLCDKTCPSKNLPSFCGDRNEPDAYAAWSLDEQIRMKSTSGGIFSEIACKYIEDGGLVVGAKYNGDHMVEHDMIRSIIEIEKLRQSKYIQSNTNDIFMRIKKEIDNGKYVAFCGSPCQVAGLLGYVGTKRENLLTIDFVCRGTNSPKAYKKYLEMLEKKYSSKIKRVWFKNKTYGWNRFSTRVDFENGKTYIKDRHTDLFMKGYIEHNLYMRDCCFKCQYKGFPRVADISLADFWGVGNIDKTLDEDKGTSLIMVNSEKGATFFRSIQDRIFCRKGKVEQALPGNACILDCPQKNPNSDRFLSLLDSKSFAVSYRKTVKSQPLKHLKRVICKFLMMPI